MKINFYTKKVFSCNLPSKDQLTSMVKSSMLYLQNEREVKTSKKAKKSVFLKIARFLFVKGKNESKSIHLPLQYVCKVSET